MHSDKNCWTEPTEAEHHITTLGFVTFCYIMLLLNLMNLLTEMKYDFQIISWLFFSFPGTTQEVTQSWRKLTSMPMCMVTLPIVFQDLHSKLPYAYLDLSKTRDWEWEWERGHELKKVQLDDYVYMYDIFTAHVPGLTE